MKNSYIKFRCTKSEKERIEGIADRSGVTLSEYCRQQCLSGRILASPKLSPVEVSYFRELKEHNNAIARCTHKDTGKPHIHVIANRIGVDGKVFDTTFMSNRSAKIAEDISREMGLTIAKDVYKQKEHKKAYTDPARQQIKEKLQQIAYYELFKNISLEGFLHGLEKVGVGIELAKNKQGKTYGIRFIYEGQTFKASEIGREFGFRSLAKNFSSSLGENHSRQVQQNHNHDTSNQQFYSGISSGIASLLADLFAPNEHSPEEEDNRLKPKKKKAKKQYYGRQF